MIRFLLLGMKNLGYYTKFRKNFYSLFSRSPYIASATRMIHGPGQTSPLVSAFDESTLLTFLICELFDSDGECSSFLLDEPKCALSGTGLQILDTAITRMRVCSGNTA